MIWLNVIAILLILTCALAKYIPLASNSWSLASDDGKYKINNAKVPGGIYTELKRTKYIKEDFFRAKNDFVYRFYSDLNWKWRLTFHFDSGNIGPGKKILLIADGIDTVSNISLNDKFVGSTDNMFVRYQFDISNIVRPEINNLLVHTLSPIQYSNESAVSFMKRNQYIIPPFCHPETLKAVCNYQYIRKMAASFAWDWGPAFPSQGIWLPIGIEVIANTILKDFYATVNSKETNWVIDITLRILKPNVSKSANVKVQIDDKEVFKASVDLKTSKVEVEHKLPQISIPKKDYTLWWPNNVGNYSVKNGFKPFTSSLYNLTVNLLDTGQASLGSITKRIGFRTVELLQERVSNQTDGLTFQFRVNGELLYLKGTNIIPFSVFPEVIDEPYIRYLMDTVVKGGMNIARVWGGALYPTDFFYNLADEMGILLWQDFMFACAGYPSEKPFLDTSAVEVSQQLDRLKHHPSIAVWAGNNENNEAIAGPWWPKIVRKENASTYIKDYVALFMTTMLPIVKEKDPGRVYLPSSPSNGLKTYQDNGWDLKPQSLEYGDMHHYDFTVDPWNSAKFPLARCISEYGLQAHPSLETYLPVIPSDELKFPLGEIFEHRQHKAEAVGWAIEFTDLNLGLPKPGGKEAFKKFIYFSQIIQSEGIKLQTEFYLRNRNSEALTWGAMYWQLNDVWQAPTWSSIEFGGKWKMLHNTIVNFFKPILVQAFKDDHGAKVIAINDMATDVNILISVHVFKFSSFNGVKLFEGSPKVKRYEAKQVYSITTAKIMAQGGCKRLSDCLIRIRYRLPLSSSSSPSSWKQSSTPFPSTLDGENYLFFGKPRAFTGMSASPPRIKRTIKVKSNSGVNRFKVEVEKDSVGAWVWLDFKIGSRLKGTFSDNGFFQFEPIKTVFFDDPTGKVTAQYLANHLEVNHYTTAKSSTSSLSPAFSVIAVLVILSIVGK